MRLPDIFSRLQFFSSLICYHNWFALRVNANGAITLAEKRKFELTQLAMNKRQDVMYNRVSGLYFSEERTRDNFHYHFFA